MMPYEVSEQIIAEVNDGAYFSYFSWQGKVPALIVALRQLPVSYGHFLEWFAKHGSHIIMR